MGGWVVDLGKWADRWKEAFGSPLPPQGQEILHILDTQEIAVKGKKNKNNNPQETKEIKGSSHNLQAHLEKLRHIL